MGARVQLQDHDGQAEKGSHQQDPNAGGSEASVTVTVAQNHRAIFFDMAWHKLPCGVGAICQQHVAASVTEIKVSAEVSQEKGAGGKGKGKRGKQAKGGDTA